MILYFSATGNSRYVARKLAESTGDTIINLQDVDSEINLKQGENLGIITPVYFQYLPSVVNDYLDSLRIKGDTSNYVFTVLTYGTFSGRGEETIKKNLEKNGLSVHATFSVKTADTWTATFDLSNQEKVARKVGHEDAQISTIAQKIMCKEKGHFQKNKTPRFIADCMYRSYQKVRKTEHLHVNDTCMGCGLCEKNCPACAITMKDGKPEWVKDQCAMCLQCLHKCPKFAIQYDDKTQMHGQYTHEKYVK